MNYGFSGESHRYYEMVYSTQQRITLKSQSSKIKAEEKSDCLIIYSTEVNSNSGGVGRCKKTQNQYCYKRRSGCKMIRDRFGLETNQRNEVMAHTSSKNTGKEILIHCTIELTIFAKSSIFSEYLLQQGSSLSESSKPLQFDVQSSTRALCQ